MMEQFFALLWGDLMLNRLLGAAGIPKPADIDRRARSANRKHFSRGGFMRNPASRPVNDGGLAVIAPALFHDPWRRACSHPPPLHVFRARGGCRGDARELRAEGPRRHGEGRQGGRDLRVLLIGLSMSRRKRQACE